jgi:two-component system chemotaxis sensor kinase CheA
MAYNPIPTFLQEAEELIADIEQSALGLAAEADQAETVNRLFRAFHTIKGSSAMCGFDAVAAFTHNVESLLDRARTGAVAVSPQLAEVVLQAADQIQVLLQAAQSGSAVPAGAGEALTGAIASFGNTAERQWKIRFRPDAALLANGGNPLTLLRELRELGACEIAAHTDAIPSLDSIQPDACYLWWEITLSTAAGENAIRDVFIFVEDGGVLEIAPAAAEPVPESASPPARETQKAAIKEATVRVPAERLDRLVRLVGEFVMNHSCLAQATAQQHAIELSNPVQVLERLVGELRDTVLGIRMLPIDTLFGRFRRLVHDLSAELGKNVDLVTEGGETELDKSILDQLGDPLVHCLRNSLDHGVEPAAERAARGKPARATIRLSAVHTGSSVVIAIEDDGRGIDREAVRAKAIEKQLVAPGATLSDRDVLNLILLPGFSTAQSVTSVSGRGVGMDAIQRQIELLRGSLALASEPGRGARVSITLPLTLAIIDGLLVEAAGDRFIVPMAAVVENVELTRQERARHNGRNLLSVRGKLVPYLNLQEIFAAGGEPTAIAKAVIVQHGEERVGLLVERVLGSHQTVIQSLGKLYRNVEVVSGATIMGDGRVALILDVARLIAFADRSRRDS